MKTKRFSHLKFTFKCIPILNILVALLHRYYLSDYEMQHIFENWKNNNTRVKFSQCSSGVTWLWLSNTMRIESDDFIFILQGICINDWEKVIHVEHVDSRVHPLHLYYQCGTNSQSELKKNFFFSWKNLKTLEHM